MQAAEVNLLEIDTHIFPTITTASPLQQQHPSLCDSIPTTDLANRAKTALIPNALCGSLRVKHEYDSGEITLNVCSDAKVRPLVNCWDYPDSFSARPSVLLSRVRHTSGRFVTTFLRYSESPSSRSTEGLLQVGAVCCLDKRASRTCKQADTHSSLCILDQMNSLRLETSFRTSSQHGSGAQETLPKPATIFPRRNSS